MHIDWLETIHVLSATVLFGTGLGIAFFMWRAHRSGDPRIMAGVYRNVVLADFVFTTPAVIVQPATGVWIALEHGMPLTQGWLLASILLYVLAGACWLPVVWLQIRARDLAVAAAETGGALPPRYTKYFRIWFALGWPAFIAVILIFFLMINKPVF